MDYMLRYIYNQKDFKTFMWSSVKYSLLKRHIPSAPFLKHDLIASLNFEGDNAPKNNADK